MKIAFFSDTYEPEINGVTKTIDKLKEYMDKIGIEYKFFVPADNSFTYKKETIPFNSFRLFLYPECKVALPKYQEAKEILDEFQPDLIHIITPFSMGLIGMKYSKENNIPMVSSYHTNFVEYFKYYKLQIFENIFWKYFLWFHSHCKINFCPSNETLYHLKEKGIENLKVWDRGIDSNKFTPEKYSYSIRNQYASDNEVLLLYVGRIAPEKELNVLINTVKILNSKNLSFKLLVVGDGPQLKELTSLNIENIMFAGYKGGDDLHKIYASSDIFVFPSSTETYGNVILEAMSSGLPVVSVASGGIKENLINGINGLEFKVGSSIDMADKIELLINNTTLREKLVQNARQHALKKSWNEVFERLFNDYTNLLTNTKNELLKEKQFIAS